MQKQHLLIIGGGAAGLMTAYLLKDKWRITILEARDYLGGRMRTIADGENIIEAGAEFVHGNLPLTMGLLSAAGIKPVATAGRMLFYKNGDFQERSNHAGDREELIKKASSLSKDMTLDEFLAKYYAGNEYREFRDDTRSFAEGFDLADPATASVKALATEWAGEDDSYRIPGGYAALINYLQHALEEAGVQIFTNVIIKQVDWQQGAVELLDQAGRHYEGARLLVTLPVSILSLTAAEASLNFTPEIDEWQEAAAQIGFGDVIKIILCFRHPFWPKDTGFVISDQPIRTWWTQLPDESPVLTGWTGGPAAEKLCRLSEAEILDDAIRSLASIFSMAETEVKALIVSQHLFNWQDNKFSFGGYSFSYPTSSVARDKLNTPVEGTIFFAGEGIYQGPHPGTVEAAFESARSAADAVLGKIVRVG